MSPDREEPTINLPNNDDGDSGSKVPETPHKAGEESEETIVAGAGEVGAGEDATVVTEADSEATIGAEGDTDPPPVRAAAAESTAATPGGASHVFANRFEVVALLGEGGMGRVYQVRDRQIEGREVALKVLRPRYSRNARFRDLFFQEIRAAQKFVSEQVNQVRDTGQMEDGRLFLTMDLVNGEDLRALMKREKSLNTRHALEIIRQMLLALQSGHEQGFVHRDVKPPNVMLATQVSKTDENPYGVGVRLLDFGIAALAAEVGEGTVAGTPMYMSPEQATGQRLDARSDLFSVGIVLYEMLSGARPFEGATLQEISTSLVETQVAPMIKGLDHLKPAVQKILRKALEKDREKRYQSAGEFIDAIENSKAYRVPTGVPGWVGGLLVLSMIAAAGEGGLLYMNQQELRRQGTELSGANNAKNTALIAAQKEHQSEMGKSKIAYEQQIAGLQTQIQDLNSNLRIQDITEGKENLDETVLEQMRRELDALTEERRVQNEKIAALEAAKTKAVEDYRDVKDRLDSAERAARPESIAAGGFDRIIESINSGFWDQVVSHEQRLDEDNAYRRAGIGGGEELRMMADAAGFLDRYQSRLKKEGVRDKGLLENATLKAAEAAANQGRFETASRAWIDFPVEGQDAAPDRLSTYSAAVETLTAAIDAAIAEHEAILVADSEAVINGPADQEPAVVFAMGEDLGWDKFDQFLMKLKAWVETSERDGKLDLAALSNDSILEDWGAYVTGSRSEVPARYADVIRWFYYAKKWYVDHDASLIGPGLGEIAQNGSAPRSDWRAVLALQIELADLPDVMGKYASWYRQESRGGKIVWVQDRIADRPEDVNGTGKIEWSVDRSSFHPAPKKQKVRFEFQNGVLYGPGNVQLVELFNSDAKLAWWAPSVEVTPQNLIQFPSDSELTKFSSSHPAPGLPCLVFVDKNGVERWFSPELGVVFEHSEDRYTRELFCR